LFEIAQFAKIDDASGILQCSDVDRTAAPDRLERSTANTDAPRDAHRCAEDAQPM